MVGQTDANIKNSTHFVQLVEDIEINDRDLLVSFDVSSLFIKVPINEAMQIVAEKLEEDETVRELPLQKHQSAG